MGSWNTIADPAATHRAHRVFVERHQVRALEPDHARCIHPARRWHQAQQGEAGQALAAARFADEGQRAPALEAEAHAVHRVDRAAADWRES